MSELKINERDVVTPGEVLATGMDYLPGMNTYRLNDNVISKRLGLVKVEGRAIKVLPLSGVYAPKMGDTIIAKVIDIAMSGWRLDIYTAYSAMLSVKDATSDYIARGADLTKFFDIGDYVVTKITNVTSQKLVDVSMKGPGLRKLGVGRIFTVSPNKVPRIIGKEGSMISMIKTKTNCQITVGQNGIVWVSGKEPHEELLAQKTILMINENAHVSGLTDRVSNFLEKGE